VGVLMCSVPGVGKLQIQLVTSHCQGVALCIPERGGREEKKERRSKNWSTSVSLVLILNNHAAVRCAAVV
jgi:hypothetical protein